MQRVASFTPNPLRQQTEEWVRTGASLDGVTARKIRNFQMDRNPIIHPVARSLS